MVADRPCLAGLVLIAAALLLPFVLGCDVPSTTAAPGGRRLQALSEAEEAYEYEGVKELTTRRRGHLSTKWYLVRHRPGRTLEMVPVGEPAGRRRPRRFPGSRLFWLADRELLLRNYRVDDAGVESVAERAGVVLDVKSFHADRPRLRMVVDEETGLLLSLERWDYRGELVFRARFETLLLSPATAEPDRKPHGFRKHSRPEHGGPRREPELGFAPLAVRHVPEGFEKKWSFPLSPGRGRWGRKNGLRTLYSDGLGLVELSQSKAEEGAEEQVVRKWEHGDRTVMKMVYRGVAVKLVGGLHPNELLEMLRSLAPREDRDSSVSE